MLQQGLTNPQTPILMVLNLACSVNQNVHAIPIFCRNPGGSSSVFLASEILGLGERGIEQQSVM